jgi:hypothetical protein
MSIHYTGSCPHRSLTAISSLMLGFQCFQLPRCPRIRWQLLPIVSQSVTKFFGSNSRSGLMWNGWTW